MAKSKIRKHKDIPNLYIDEITGIFYIRVYDLSGKLRTKSLGTKSEGIAKLKISSAIKEIATTEKKKLKNKLVADYIPGFWEDLESQDLSEGSMDSARTCMKHHLEPFWAKVRDTEITREKYTEFLAWHKKKKMKLFNPAKTLRKLFDYMKSQGAPIGEIEVYLTKSEIDSNAESKGTFIEEKEIKRILAAKLLKEYPRERLMFTLAYVYGFRVGELTNLKKDRIQRLKGTITICLKASDTKTRTERRVPLTNEHGRSILSISSAARGEYVFPSRKNDKIPVSKQHVDRIWALAKKDAGIYRRLRFHDLRHTAATNMANLGVVQEKACAILGMSNTIYSRVYVKKQSLDLVSAIDILSKGVKL